MTGQSVARYFTEVDLSVFDVSAEFWKVKCHKFYLPDGQTMASNLLDDEVKTVANLPFPNIFVLHPFYDSFLLTFSAQSSGAEFMAQALASNFPKPSSMRALRPDDKILSMMTVLFKSENGKIKNEVVPASLIVQISTGSIDFHLIDLESPNNISVDAEHALLLHEGKNAILSLCLMLSLQNVSSEKVSASEKLNKKRIKCGNLPLADYHILVVDGERWDSPKADSEGSGVRSHWRRSHIRRIKNPDRKIFVRNCFVHGSRPGIVQKDYAVTSN